MDTTVIKKATRVEPVLTQADLKRLPLGLALRLSSQLASSRPDFAARAWIELGCLAHEPESRSLGESAERSWVSYPAAPLILARGASWPQVAACLTELRGLRALREEQKKEASKTEGASKASAPSALIKNPFHESESRWGSGYEQSDRIGRLEAGVFLSQMLCALAKAPASQRLELGALAIEACAPSPGRHGESYPISAKALSALAFAGEVELLELIANKWGRAALSSGYSGKELSAPRLDDRDFGKCRGDVTALCGLATIASDAQFAELLEKSVFDFSRSSEPSAPNPWVCALRGPEPAKAIAALLGPEGLPEELEKNGAARWLAQSPDAKIARQAARLAVSGEAKKAQIKALYEEARAQASPKKRGQKKAAPKSALPPGPPREILMALLDRVCAGDAPGAELLLSECHALGVCPSASPCAPLLGADSISLAALALMCGRAPLASAWIRQAPNEFDAQWTRAISALVDEAGAPVEGASDDRQTPVLLAAQYERGQEGSGPSLSVEMEWSDRKNHSARQLPLSPYTLALLREDGGLARELHRRLTASAEHAALLESAIKKDSAVIKSDHALLARWERAMLGMQVDSVPRDRAPENKRKGP